MRTRISTTVDHERLTIARTQTGLPDAELIDLALGALLERAERDAEDQAFNDNPYVADPDMNNLPTGLPTGSPPLDDYDDAVPPDVLALFAARVRK
jgi:hypothetical protein